MGWYETCVMSFVLFTFNSSSPMFNVPIQEKVAMVIRYYYCNQNSMARSPALPSIFAFIWDTSFAPAWVMRNVSPPSLLGRVGHCWTSRGRSSDVFSNWQPSCLLTRSRREWMNGVHYIQNANSSVIYQISSITFCCRFHALCPWRSIVLNFPRSFQDHSTDTSRSLQRCIDKHWLVI